MASNPIPRRAAPAYATAALLAGLAGGCGASQAPERPNLVLIVLDTARADMTSAYGWPRPTTPFLEELASLGTRFDRAYSTSSWTLPAHASMFTGELPDRHAADQVSGHLQGQPPLLAEELAGAGYQTACFTRNPWISQRSGLQRGFEHFAAVWPGAEPELEAGPGNPAVRGVRDWLARQRDTARPYFLFVNLIRPHLPYAPSWRMASGYLPDQATWRDALTRYSSRGPRYLFNRHYAREEPFGTREWELIAALYQAELGHVDALARRIVEAVDASGDGRETLLLVVSDHGENLGDHDHASHVFSLNEALIRVVCIGRGPGFEAGRVDHRLAQLTDVHATLLAAAGLPVRSPAGRDLRAPPQDGRLLLARIAWPLTWLGTFDEDVLMSGALDPYRCALWSVRDERFKLVASSDGLELLYDLTTDPGEERPLDPAAIDAPRLARLRQAIVASRARNSGMPAPDAETGGLPDAEGAALEALRALGYAR